MKLGKFIATVCLVSFASGCSKTPEAPSANAISNKNLRTFEASGKMGFSNGQKGGNANLQWAQAGDNYRINVYGPFGSGSMNIEGQNGRVLLTSAEGKVYHASTPEELVRKELGWEIPVNGLRYWLQGIAAPGTPPSHVAKDSNNRLARIVQHGWTVDYEDYQEVQGKAVPYKMQLQNGDIRLKFIFNQWHLN